MDSVCFMDIWDMRMNLKALMRRIRNPILFAILPDIQRPHIWMSWLCHKDERNEAETNRRKERIYKYEQRNSNAPKGVEKKGECHLEGLRSTSGRGRDRRLDIKDGLFIQ